ncbi:hypothetical protein LCGC14_1121260 [marine sediment metagenome]|uniref:Uncharacterized protein n=1 Tax=marine sediment metagenome TaxID=412755 RepID=A0A0F9M3V5_9ZZZZ
MTSPRTTGVEHQWTSGVERTDVHITQQGAGSGVGSPTHDEQHSMSSHTDRHKGADIASATTVTFGTDGDYFDITGAVNITAFATRDAGDVVRLQFDAVLTITHKTDTLNLRSKVDITTHPGFVLTLISEGSGEWREVARSESGTNNETQGVEAADLQVVIETETSASVKQEVAGQSITGALQVVVETTTGAAADTT